jgi:hypothetical protein
VNDEVRQLQFQLAIVKQQRNQAYDELTRVTAQFILLEEKLRQQVAPATEAPSGDD